MNSADGRRPPAGPEALGEHDIQMRMLAARHHVPGLRALVTERALRMDHDLDFVDDARLAMDELCAIALLSCAPTDLLTVRLLVDAHRVEFSARVPADPSARTAVDRLSLSLQVLRSLADSLDYGMDVAGQECCFSICFARHRRRQGPHGR